MIDLDRAKTLCETSAQNRTPISLHMKVHGPKTSGLLSAGGECHLIEHEDCVTLRGLLTERFQHTLLTSECDHLNIDGSYDFDTTAPKLGLQ